jgi:hypothetical protein
VVATSKLTGSLAPVGPNGGTVKKLDPGDPVQKKQIKASITDSIAKEVVGSNRTEIAEKVEALYEKLLIGAVIFTHIPSLTAGSVRREIIGSGVESTIPGR